MAELSLHAPDDQSLVGTVSVDDGSSVDEKVAAAAAAMAEWAATAPMSRAETMVEIAAATRREQDALAEALSKEQGKTLQEARLELDRYVGAFLQYAGLGTAVGGRHVLLGGGISGQVALLPVGVSVGIVPWNFPASLFASKLAPALAAGCGFLIKPAETTSLITLRLAEIASQLLPPGLLSVVVGGADIGERLVAHPDVARVAFTGSTPVGRRIGALAGHGLKRVSLELGGCDPFVLLDDADVPAAMRAVMGTRFFNAGQVCVAPKRLVVHERVADEAVALLTERVARVVVGSGLDPASRMGPLHTERAREVVEAQAADAVDRGAELIGGGRPAGDAYDSGWYVRPALVVDPPEGARVRTEETFGPLLTVIRVGDDDAAVRVANETPYALGASVWSGDPARARRIAARVPAGYTWINALGRVYDELPFGGVGASGLGREHGVEALESYVESRTYVLGS
jgi:acyl-CoA reductase-like NAD-dependent aldehyde dehydrogenase